MLNFCTLLTITYFFTFGVHCHLIVNFGTSGPNSGFENGPNSSDDNEKYPYQVILAYHKDILFCGGSIITNKYVLTSAMCIADSNVPDWEVKAGSPFLLLDPKEHAFVTTIKKFCMHPKFHPWFHDNLDYSIALAELKTELPLGSDIQTIPIGANMITKPFEGVVNGWNTLNLEGTSVSQTRIQTMHVMAKMSTDEHYILVEHMESDHDNDCIEDFGGPLMFNKTLYGVMVTIDGCKAATKQPRQYFNVVLARDWIYSITNM